MLLFYLQRTVPLLFTTVAVVSAGSRQATSSKANNANANAGGGPPLPSSAQQRGLDIGLAMFIHYSVNPWVSPHLEHNCVGRSADCIPASKFNPTNLSTDQWVEAAVAMGAKEICLTAHHEGGFCLWDTNYTDYNVMNSPYGKDIVKEFVASCKKYDVSPCYYLGPNANGYLSNKKKLSPEAFIQAQLGMLSELLTKYELQPSRLWWDHWLGGCNDRYGLDPCPDGAFPDAWVRFVDLVRALSPQTLICPGPDCDGHQGESGYGKYPSWNPCQPYGLACVNHAPNAQLAGFNPYEACATMVNGAWFCQGDGSTQTFWTAGQIWDHYMASVGVGWINTLNAPVCTTGQIHPKLVQEMTIFGNAIKSLFKAVHAEATDIVSDKCNNTTLVTLDAIKGDSYNAVILKEDLSQGQRITKYAMDYYDSTKDNWLPLVGKGIHGQSVGNLLIDWLDNPIDTTVGTKFRLRCLEAMQVPIYLKSVSLHTGSRPDGDDVDVNVDADTTVATAVE